MNDIFGWGIELNSSSYNCKVQNNTIIAAVLAGIQLNGTKNQVIGNDISKTNTKNDVNGYVKDADGMRFFWHRPSN